MNRFLFALLLLLPATAIALPNTLYFDGKWKEATKKKAAYYQLANKVGEVYNVNSYFINGSKYMDGVYLSMQPEIKYGAFTYYGADGKVASEGRYADNKRDGQWAYYFAGTTRIHKTCEYKDDKIDGVFILNDSLTGNRLNSRKYSRGKLEGPFITYSTSTRKMVSAIEYKEGYIHGMVSHFDSVSGYKKAMGNVFNEKREGEWIFYYPRSEQIGTKVHYVNGFRKGMSTSFYATGKRLMQGMYDEGSKEGEWTFYYEDGHSKSSTIEFHKSTFNGEAVYFDSATGNVIAKGDFLSGVKTGRWDHYYPGSGKPEWFETYMFGKHYGAVGAYYETGTESFSGSFHKDIPVGDHQYYFMNGKVRTSIKFPGSEGYGVVRLYDSASRKVMVKGEMQGAGKTGNWYKYHTGTDVLAESMRYKDGALDGECATYTVTGSKVHTGSYKNGEREGKWVYYDTSLSRPWATLEYEGGVLINDLYVYHDNGQVKRHEVYMKGKLGESECFSDQGAKLDCAPLVRKAAFDGEASSFIGRELRYPEVSRSEGVEGKVVVSFTVNEDGTLSDIEVTKSLNTECDNEAKRIIAAMPKWRPFRFDDRSYKWHTSLPIVFWIPEQSGDGGE